MKVNISGKPKVSLLRNSLMGIPVRQPIKERVNILQDILINPIFDLVTPDHQEDFLSEDQYNEILNEIVTSPMEYDDVVAMVQDDVEMGEPLPGPSGVVAPVKQPEVYHAEDDLLKHTSEVHHAEDDFIIQMPEVHHGEDVSHTPVQEEDDEEVSFPNDGLDHGFSEISNSDLKLRKATRDSQPDNFDEEDEIDAVLLKLKNKIKLLTEELNRTQLTYGELSSIRIEKRKIKAMRRRNSLKFRRLMAAL